MAIKQTIGLLMICLALAGCWPLAPRPDNAKFFVLTSINENGIPTPATAKLAIGVGPIDLPGYLQRTHVVTRSAPTRIELLSTARRGEPLDKNFKRALAENLAQLRNTYRIEEYPWNHETTIDYQVAIQVLNFETTTDGQSMLRARWVIKGPRSKRDLYATETTAHAPIGPGDAGFSAALSTDLATFSQATATEIQVLDRPAVAPT